MAHRNVGPYFWNEFICKFWSNSSRVIATQELGGAQFINLKRYLFDLFQFQQRLL